MRFKRMADLDLRGKRVFIRADLNVPQDDAGHITDDTRIRASVGGIRLALEKGAAVMVTSHLGRPKEGEFKPEDSLAPVAKRLGELLGREVPLKRDWVDGVAVKPGEVVLLENCRVNKGEKKDDEGLARKIAALCDVPARVKGRGMMRGIDVGSGERAAAITAAAFDLGIVIETSGPHDEVVKVLAPLTIEDDVLANGLDLLARAFRTTATEPLGAAA